MVQHIKQQQNPGDPSQSQNPGKIVPITPSQIIKFEFVRSPAPWEIKSLQKASIAKTLSTLTAHKQAQNLVSAKSIDCPFSHNQLSSCIHYKYICIPASISFKRKKIFNKSLKILFYPKLSWQEIAIMSSPAKKKGKGKVLVRKPGQNLDP